LAFAEAKNLPGNFDFVCPEIVLPKIEIPTFNRSLVINPQKAAISIDKVCPVSGISYRGTDTPGQSRGIV
jgi:hypothetical protein